MLIVKTLMLSRVVARLSSEVMVTKPLRGLVHIELSRPEKRNALTLEMGESLIKALGNITNDSTVRAVILSGSGASFCTGRDLKISANHTEEQAEKYLNMALQSVIAVFNLPVPVIAAVHGHAIGYGLELATACDIKVIHPKTEMSFPETSLGIFPGAGGAVLLPLLFGEAKALDWILTSRKIPIDESMMVGLATYVNESPLEKAFAVAQEVIARPPLGYRAAKAIIKRRITKEIDGWLQEAHEARSKVGKSQDHHEALKAFVEKRRPVFTGQ